MLSNINAVYIDNYRANLFDNHRAVDLPYAAILCKNVLCCDSGHRQAMNNFAIEITQACLLASSCSIPSTGRSDTRSKKVPGWTENISGHFGLLFLRAPYKFQFYLLTYLTT